MKYWEKRQISLRTPIHLPTYSLPCSQVHCGSSMFATVGEPILTYYHYKGYGLYQGPLLVCVASVDSLGLDKCALTQPITIATFGVFPLPLTTLNHMSVPILYL